MRIDTLTVYEMRQHVPTFLEYLREHGCEIQPLCSEYELVRFKSAIGVGVVYHGARGLSTNMPFVADALNLYQKGVTWQMGKVTPSNRRSFPKRKVALYNRDGPNCWYCNQPLGDDATQEHLVSRTQHGANTLDNIVLAHAKCNNLAGHKSLVEKVLLRDQMRKEHANT